MIRTAIQRALTDESSGVFHRLTTALAVLTLVSVSATAGETIPVFGPYSRIFITIEWITILVFTIEYVLRIWTASDPRKYILSYFGLLDLVSILPTYLGMGSLAFLKSARIVRAMNFMRIVGRANTSHVQRKGELISRDFEMNPKLTFGILILGFILTVVLYHTLIERMTSVEHVVQVFIGLLHAPNSMGFGGALILVAGRVFGALSLGFFIGHLIEYVREQRMKRGV